MNFTSEHILSAQTAATWLAANGAAWCHRLNATITTATCLTNMYVSEGKNTDLRCAGCGGLDNQPGPERSFLPPVMVEEIAAETTEVDETPAGIVEPVEAEDTLFDLESDDDLSGICGDTTNSFHQALLAELEDDFEDVEPEELELDDERPTYHQTRVAVFMGRCPRCNGYMLQVPEYQGELKDVMVYRCYACGWRTSPTYEQNRQMIEAGKENRHKHGF